MGGPAGALRFRNGSWRILRDLRSRRQSRESGRNRRAPTPNRLKNPAPRPALCRSKRVPEWDISRRPGQTRQRHGDFVGPQPDSGSHTEWHLLRSRWRQNTAGYRRISTRRTQAFATPATMRTRIPARASRDQRTIQRAGKPLPQKRECWQAESAQS